MVIQKSVKIFKQYQTFFVFFLIFGLSLFLFYPSLNYYFFQDDWFVLNWIRTGDFLSFFKFRTDIIYWRPLSMPLFFALSERLFGLNSLGYHLIVFLLHFLNVVLIGYITYKLIGDKKTAVISSFLYATAAFQFMPLSWLSLTWNIVGLFFFLLSFIFYMRFKEKKSITSLLMTFILFLLALFSFEFAIVFPVLILLYEYLSDEKFNKNLSKSIPVVLPILFVIVTYLFLRFVLYPVPSQGQYTISIGPDVLKNLLFYGLWLFNIPEELKYQIVVLRFYITPNLLRAAENFLVPIVLLFFLNVFSLIIIVIYTLDKKIKKFLFSAIVFFIIGLSPILFLPKHTFPYYLAVPSILVFIFCGLVVASYMKKFQNKKKMVVSYIFIISWLSLSFLTITLTRKIHWVSGEQSISKNTVEKVLSEYPNLPDSKTIVITGSNDQLKQSLMDQDALKVIYNSDEVQTIYR